MSEDEEVDEEGETEEEGEAEGEMSVHSQLVQAWLQKGCSVLIIKGDT